MMADLFDSLGGNTTPAILHPGLSAADYRASDTLRDVANWQARILVGNSIADGKRRGDWDNVGYVMISMTGEIRAIPVARGDEHDTGYDLLHRMARKWRISPAQWTPISTSEVGIYLYAQAEVRGAVAALERWHRAGGPDVVVCSTGYEDLAGKRWRVGSRDFVAGKGTPQAGPDGLLPIGQRCVDALKGASTAIAALRQGSTPWDLQVDLGHKFVALRRATRTLMALVEANPALAFEAFYDDATHAFTVGEVPQGSLAEAVAVWTASLEGELAAGSAEGVKRILFWHRGFKNRLHMRIRQQRRGPASERGLIEFFGDLGLADDAMGRISPGLLAAQVEAALASGAGTAPDPCYPGERAQPSLPDNTF